jgi:hypothetical protein
MFPDPAADAGWTTLLDTTNGPYGSHILTFWRDNVTDASPSSTSGVAGPWEMCACEIVLAAVVLGAPWLPVQHLSGSLNRKAIASGFMPPNKQG